MTVAVITRDRTDYLARTLASVLAGRVRPDRLVVIDNSTVDPAATERVCASFDGQVEYLAPCGNLSLNENHRRALGVATTDLMSLLHDDDLHGPDFMAVGRQAFVDHPDATLFAVNYAVVDRSDAVIQAAAWSDFPEGVLSPGEFLLVAMQKRSPVHFSAALMRTSAAQASHLHEADGNCGDMGYFFQVAAKGRTVLVDRPMASIRVHETAISETAGWFSNGTSSAVLALYPLELVAKNRFLASAEARHALGSSYALARKLAARSAWRALSMDLRGRHFDAQVRRDLLRAWVPITIQLAQRSIACRIDRRRRRKAER